MTKQDQANAEKAAMWWAKEQGFIHLRKAIRTMYQKVDFFGADIMGMDVKGFKCFIQVTTGGYEAQRQRRRKLEKFDWHDLDWIVLLVMSKEKEGRSYKYYFDSYVFQDNKTWFTRHRCEIPREWFKKYEG